MQNVLSLNNFNLSYAGYDLILGSSGPVPPIDPYNPLNLPPYVIRVQYQDGVIPYLEHGYNYTVERVSYYPNVWDIYHPQNNWGGEWGIGSLFPDTDKVNLYPTKITEILGANTTNVTNLDRAFENCLALSSISLFDTRNVTSMSATFYNCGNLSALPLYDTYNVVNMDSTFKQCNLTSIPLFDTTSVTSMNETFFYDINVKSGMYALYQQASTQTIPPSSHYNTFRYCGLATQEGNAERALIPTSWGGDL